MFLVESSEWIVPDEDVRRGIYPDKNPGLARNFLPEVYSHSELFGDSYVISTCWDEGEDIAQCDIFLPEIPSETFFDDDFSSAIFRYKDSYFLVTGFNDNYMHICENYDDSYYQLYCLESSTTAYVYTLSYPFTDWVFYSSESCYPYSFVSEFFPSSYELLWTDTPIYDYVDPEFSYVTEPSNFDVFDKLYTHNFSKTLSYTSGILYFSIPEDVFKSLLGLNVAFLLEDFGYIIGTASQFVYLTYNATFYVDGELFGTADFMDYTYQGWITGDAHPPGYAYINDYYDPIDLTRLSSFDSGVEILFTFQFASDGNNLVFPGTFSIVDYNDLRSEVQHKDIINQIDTSAGAIITSIGDSANLITGSIGNLNTNIEYIISGDIEIEQPDMDTAELDAIISEQDELIGNIISSLNDDISDYVPAGYNSYAEYLIDNINSFKSDEYNNTFSFIRSTFDSLIASLSILPLVLFSLTFGFAVFALGRRLS